MKLAVFDFDGTILFPDGIAAGTVEAIRDWQDAGHLAVAATGKSLHAAQYAFDGADIAFDYSVLFTGAVITDRAGEVLHGTTLSPDIVAEIVDRLSGLEGVAVYATLLRGRDARFSSTVPTSAKNTILVDFQELTPADIADHEFVGAPIWVPEDQSLRRDIHAWITETFDVECALNQSFIDVIPTGTTKGAGLAWLGDHLGVKRSEVEMFTFGDSWNDLSMHAIADRAFSFPWSPDEVKAATDEVIGSVAATLPRLLDQPGS